MSPAPLPVRAVSFARRHRLLIGLGAAFVLLSFFGTALLLVWMLARSLEGRPVSFELNRAPSARLSASELYQAYEGNEAAADQRFRGKIVEVTGLANPRREGRGYSVTWDGRFAGPPPPAEALTSEQFARAMQEAAANAVYIPAVVAHLDDDQAGKLAQLPPGASVTVRGKCEGSTHDQLGTPDYVVSLDGCRVVSVEGGR